ncbi:MAG: chemotaxis protein CheW [Proteobacteria bacterium]|nr:purine-binding chemotaxis protein CheW [Desulfobacula sp.]MBU3951627.1 chemotaxis protein CheW [Pseudomonadota bacterium]MBU4132777.1 chemotaxis protein CheW [Pseudomonadota bacterium]
MTENTMETSSADNAFSTFHLGTSLFGINILEIQEINKNFEITQVPHASDYIKGIINLRGQIVTIIDLGRKLGLNPVQKNKDNKNIIVHSENEHIGLLVDAIHDVVHAKIHDIETAPSNIGEIKGKYLQGVLKNKKQLIGILNMTEILKD